MAPRIRAHYHDLVQVQKAMADEADAVLQITNHLKTHINSLHGKSWAGRGSDAFFRDMEEIVLPGLTRLNTALTRCSEVIGETSHIFPQADQILAALAKN